MSADEQVIKMVNAPHERRKQLLAKSRAAKRARRLQAQKSACSAKVVGAMLRLAVALELVILALAAGFVIAAG